MVPVGSKTPRKKGASETSPRNIDPEPRGDLCAGFLVKVQELETAFKGSFQGFYKAFRV